MRNYLVLLASTALTACGGAGVNAVGSNSPSSGGGTISPTTPDSGHTFIAPKDPKTYSAIGGVHSYNYKTSNDANAPSPGYQYNQDYAGNASTARNSKIEISYDPRDAIFELTVVDEDANVEIEHRFQDPAHRVNFGGLNEPQGGTPDLAIPGMLYLQTGSTTNKLTYNAGSNVFPDGLPDGIRDYATFFYQKPGTVTKYVTFAGYVRNQTSVVLVEPKSAPAYVEQQHKLERAAFAYGERTANAGVPITGSASYTGSMIASLVYNPLIDTEVGAPTYFQWMAGNATTNINFATNLFTYSMNGTVGAPLLDIFTSKNYVLQQGATFTAAGDGRIDLVKAGGFLGQMTSASFTQPNGTKLNMTIAGSSVDGAFYGDKAQEVGGGFRIVGGVPDERIDILGAFTGKQ
ncbi:MAG TPA: transferrin-binding protein-like solute binding protein [Chakrabartia sp.]|nr:transferrin-binding protein-like solute binding protein [Chakrabartia sp.]